MLKSFNINFSALYARTVDKPCIDALKCPKTGLRSNTSYKHLNR